MAGLMRLDVDADQQSIFSLFSAPCGSVFGVNVGKHVGDLARCNRGSLHEDFGGGGDDVKITESAVRRQQQTRAIFYGAP